MQNEYRPFNEIEFDFTTSLSKEAAVMAMLGWMKKPYREVSEAEYDYRHRVDCERPVSEEEEIMFERHSPSLFEVLREIKESADSEYVSVKIEEPLDEDALAESLANIKKSHELIETAHKFYCDIADEQGQKLNRSIESLLKFAKGPATETNNEPHNGESDFEKVREIILSEKNRSDKPEAHRFADIIISRIDHLISDSH